MEGKVFSGRGEGKKFVELPWVKRQIEEKLGFSPFAGTLNVRLTEESVEKRKQLTSARGFCVEPQAGYCDGLLFKATLGGLDCAVVLPLVPNYPPDVLEVIAPIYLRSKLGLRDGNSVAITVNV